MEIYFQDDRAFVNLHTGYMLCIGSREEVEKADERRLVRMIYEAIVWNKYFMIQQGKGQRVH